MRCNQVRCQITDFVIDLAVPWIEDSKGRRKLVAKVTALVVLPSARCLGPRPYPVGGTLRKRFLKDSMSFATVMPERGGQERIGIFDLAS
jgi:uncharacterized metal-binding protein YceD (DUF177 family)